MIFPKNGGSIDAIDHFWGECSSKVIFLGGVEIKLVDFGGSVVLFQENLGGGTTFLQKSTRMGGGRYLSKEMGYLRHQILGLQSLKWGEVTYIWTQLWGEGR